MKYTVSFFRDTMPEWKRKKDPILSRLFYRPMGYVLAAFFANRGIGANAVSYLSAIEAVIACALFLPKSHACHVLGALLVNLWLILDCTDGCIARSVKSEPFGEFADGISSYIIVALIGGAMGMAAYFEGGLLIKAGNAWLILMGALASTGDTLMRLVYQKYQATEREEAEKGRIKKTIDVRKDHDKVGSLRVKIEQDLGMGGILPAIILVCSLLRCLDIALLYCLAYYGLSSLAVIGMYVGKAIKAAQEHE